MARTAENEPTLNSVDLVLFGKFRYGLRNACVEAGYSACVLAPPISASLGLTVTTDPVSLNAGREIIIMAICNHFPKQPYEVVVVAGVLCRTYFYVHSRFTLFSRRQ